MMSTLMLNPTSMAQWHKLVHEAELAIAEHLEEALESYLVFLLMRYTCQPALGTRVVALDFLEGMTTRGRSGQKKLRDVGDCCLLFAGLFRIRAAGGCFADDAHTRRTASDASASGSL
jgi:hypothetical protein